MSIRESIKGTAKIGDKESIEGEFGEGFKLALGRNDKDESVIYLYAGDFNVKTGQGKITFASAKDVTDKDQPKVNSKAKMEVRADGSIVVDTTKEATISMVSGQWMPVGNGTVFLTGSVLRGAEVTKGDLQMIYSDGKLIYRSADSRKVTTTQYLDDSKTKILTVNYNTSGVTNGYITDNVKGKTIELGGNKVKATNGSIIYNIVTEKVNGYNILATTKDGQYKISSVEYKNVQASRTVGTKELSAVYKYDINGVYDVQTQKFKGKWNVNISVIDAKVNGSKPMPANLVKVNKVKVNKETNMAITKDGKYAYKITDKGITRANGSYQFVTASVKEGKNVLNIYGTLDCKNGKI
ncbi:MAG: hypothetical protein QME68_08690, partial [Elusimicrobiota bacterium]|nr:hypothetical protein [Elusimicrobiota bacterium]